MPLSQTATETATTIIKQMGGHAALNAMLGIKKYAGSFYLVDEKENNDVRIQFDFKAKNTRNIKRVVITHVYETDTYSMELWKRLSDNQMSQTLDWSIEELADKFRVAYFEDIYCDDLQRIFCETTGLSLTVPTIVR